jgi:glycosyltransferase involved in cell wall biosynthesis
MKIGLGLIVRNESHDLPRCLESFLPHVDSICIVDTGSTDDTVEIAERILKASGKAWTVQTYLEASDSEGRLEDFSKARNEYVRILESWRVGYILSIDADDTYLAPSNLKDYMLGNPADIYAFKYHNSDTSFFLSYKLWRTGLGIKYVGKVHEVLNFSWDFNIRNDTAIEIKHHPGMHDGQEHGGERNRRILRKEIYPSFRSMFYWANEHVDIGDYKEAIKWYREYIRRATEGKEQAWGVELAHCFWRAARWSQHIGDTDTAIALSEQLLTIDSTWSESWCELAYISRLKGDFEGMKRFAIEALKNQWTPRLFSEQDKYTTTPANMLVIAEAHAKLGALQNDAIC